MSKSVYVVELVEKYRPFEEIMGIFATKQLAVEFLFANGYVQYLVGDQFHKPGEHLEYVKIHAHDLIENHDQFWGSNNPKAKE